MSAGRAAERRAEPPRAVCGPAADRRTAADRGGHRGPEAGLRSRPRQTRDAGGIGADAAHVARRPVRRRRHLHGSAPMNVLMTAASRRVALAHAFQAALRPYGGRLLVTDVDPSSPAVHVADRAYRVPYWGDPQYIPELLRICSAEHVRLVVPTIDDELESLAAARPD